MYLLKKHLGGVLVSIAILVMGFGTGLQDNSLLKGNSYAKCDTLTETLLTIGDEESTQILTATSGRSYAMLQLTMTSGGVATNTASIAFGSTATLANGIQLSTTTPTLVFGMDTNHAYSGIVSAITDNGSTTLRVTECR